MKKIKISLIVLISFFFNLEAEAQVKFKEVESWGYKDIKTNSILIKPKFGYAEDFKDGFAVVSEDATTSGIRKKLKVINNKGEFIVDSAYEYIENMGLGLFTIGIPHEFGNVSYGIIDKTGKILIEPELNTVSKSSDGLIVVSKGKKFDAKFGAIDMKGNLVIPFQDYAMSDFNCGVSVINKISQRGLMNKSGKIILSPDSSGIVTIDKFNKHCVAEFKKGSRYGLINSSGKILAEPEYSRSSGLNDNGVTYFKDGKQVLFTGTGQKK